MSQYEDIFMTGFSEGFGGEKTAQAEMPVLEKAMGNLGLLEEAPAQEIEMPIFKKAMENLGMEAAPAAGEETAVEATSMLEALAIVHGPAVVAEREKTAAMEKGAKKTTFIMGKGTGGVKKPDLKERIRSFTSKHKGKFKIGGAAAGGAAVGALTARLGKKKEKKGKK